MLALQYIRENRDAVIKGLQKRNFPKLDLVDQIITLDQQRRNEQALLDQKLAAANQLAKEIGILFKKGEIEKANVLKAETTDLKNETNSSRN